MAKKAPSVFSLMGNAELLKDVREVRHPLDMIHPMWVFNRCVSDNGRLPRPTVPYPERHPYCEFNIMLEGEGDQFIGVEKIARSAGDLMLIGPGTSHYGMLRKSPSRVIVVYCLPILFFEMGPCRDGVRLLSRFTAARSIAQRVVRPSKAVQSRITFHFEEMLKEFNGSEAGSELSVRARLMDALVELLRWEALFGKEVSANSSLNWEHVEKALHFIYQNYAEPLYIEQIAREAGIGPGNLHTLFRKAFGMSCLQYLRAYRISHAASLLCLPEARVTEIAFKVGFETLSHFNTSFRHFLRMSPREYIRSAKNPKFKRYPGAETLT